MEEEKLTKKQAYEAMIHLLYRFYKETGSNDLTDILSGGEYGVNTDKPMDLAFKYKWDEIVKDVLEGLPPKRKVWI